MSTERPLPPYGPDGELPDDYVPPPHLDQTLEPVDGVVQPPILPPRWRPGRMTNLLQYMRKNALMAVRRHKYAWPFLQPVNSIKLQIPDYHHIVKRPMDLTTINRRIDNCYYWDASECIDDFDLMISNCFKYNGHEADVAIMARTLRDIFYKRMDKAPKAEVAMKCIRTLPMQPAPGTKAPRGRAAKVKQAKDPPPKKERAPRKQRKPREKKKYLSKKYVSSTSGSETEFESQLRKELYDQEAATKKADEGGESEMPAQDPEWDILEGLPLPEAFHAETNSDTSKSSLPHKPVTKNKRGRPKREDADAPSTSKPIAKAKRGRPRKRKDSPTPATEEMEKTNADAPLKELPIINLADVDMKYQLGLSPTPFLLPVPSVESYNSPSTSKELKPSKPPRHTGKNIAACAEVILTEDPRSLLSPVLLSSPTNESVGSSPHSESLVELSPQVQPCELDTALPKTTNQPEELPMDDIANPLPMPAPQPPTDNFPSDDTSPANVWNSPLHMLFDNEKPSSVDDLVGIQKRKSSITSPPKGKSPREDSEKPSSPPEPIEPTMDVPALPAPYPQTRGPKRRLSESKISPSRHSKEHKRKSKEQQSHGEVPSTSSSSKSEEPPRVTSQRTLTPSQEDSTSLSSEIKASDDSITSPTESEVAAPPKGDTKKSHLPLRHDIEKQKHRNSSGFDSRHHSKESNSSSSSSRHDKERKRDGKKSPSSSGRTERKPKHQEPPSLLPLEPKEDVMKSRSSSNEAKERNKQQQPTGIAPLKRKEDSDTIAGFPRAAIERRKVPAIRQLEGKKENKEARSSSNETKEGQESPRLPLDSKDTFKKMAYRIPFKENRERHQESPGKHLLDRTEKEKERHLSLKDSKESPGILPLDQKEKSKKGHLPSKESREKSKQQQPPGIAPLERKEEGEKIGGFPKEAIERRKVVPRIRPLEKKAVLKVRSSSREAIERRRGAPRPVEDKEGSKVPRSSFKEAIERRRVASGHRSMEDKKESKQPRSFSKEAIERRKAAPGIRIVEGQEERKEPRSSSRESIERRRVAPGPRPVKGKEENQEPRSSSREAIERRKVAPGILLLEGKDKSREHRSSSREAMGKRRVAPGPRPVEGKEENKEPRSSSRESIERRRVTPGPRPEEGKQESKEARSSSREAIERRKVAPGIHLLEGKENGREHRSSSREAMGKRRVAPGPRPVEDKEENKEPRSSSRESIERRRVAPGPRPEEGKQESKEARSSSRGAIERRKVAPGIHLLEGKEKSREHRSSSREAMGKRRVAPGPRPVEGKVVSKVPRSSSKEAIERRRVASGHRSVEDKKESKQPRSFSKEAIERHKAAPGIRLVEGKEERKEPRSCSRESIERRRVAPGPRPVKGKEENKEPRSSSKEAIERRRVAPGSRPVEGNEKNKEARSSSKAAKERDKCRGPPRKIRRVLKEGNEIVRTPLERPNPQKPPGIGPHVHKEDVSRGQRVSKESKENQPNRRGPYTIHVTVPYNEDRQDRRITKELKEKLKRRLKHVHPLPKYVIVQPMNKKLRLVPREARLRQRNLELFGESPRRREEDRSSPKQRRHKRKVRSPTPSGSISPIEPDSMLKPSDEILACHEILNTLMSNKYEAIAWPFYKQLTNATNAGMEQYMKAENPMDLSTIKRKLNGNYYVVREEFAYDVRLIFNNCFDLLPPEHDIYDMAIRLRDVFEGLFTQIDVALSNGMCVPSQCPDLNQLRDPALDNRIHYLTELEADFQRMMVSIKGVVQQMEQQRMPPEEAMLHMLKSPSEMAGAKKKCHESDKTKTRGKDLTEEERIQKNRERLAKARAALSKPITLDEIQKLTCDISKMPADKLGHIVHILRTREPSYQDTNPNEVEIDLEPLNPRTIRELQMFVSSTLRQKRVVYYNPKAGLTRKEQALEKQKALEERLRELSSSLHKKRPTGNAPPSAKDKSYSGGVLAKLTKALNPPTKPSTSSFSSSSDLSPTSSDDEIARLTLNKVSPKTGVASIPVPAGSIRSITSPARPEVSARSSTSSAGSEASVRSSTSPVRSEESARFATSPVRSEESARSATSPARSEESGRSATSPVRSEESARSATSPARSEESARSATSPARSEESARPATSPIRSEESARSATSPVRSEESARSATSPARSEESARSATSPARSEGSHTSAISIAAKSAVSDTSTPAKSAEDTSNAELPVKSTAASSSDSDFDQSEMDKLREDLSLSSSSSD